MGGTEDAAAREKIREKTRALCLEMEAAGLMTNLHWIVARGFCDSSQSYKNKAWQRYAAMAGASDAKELLQYVSQTNLTQQVTLRETFSK